MAWLDLHGLGHGLVEGFCKQGMKFEFHKGGEFLY